MTKQNLKNCLFYFGATRMNQSLHLLVSCFISVRVHGGQEVDSSVGDQSDDTLVSLLVLTADVLHEVEDQLSAKNLVPVHPCHISKLWLTCQERKENETPFTPFTCTKA